MLRSSLLFLVSLTMVSSIAAQSIPTRLLSAPNRLELDKPTAEAKAGSRLTYKVTLKDAQNQPVAATSNMQLEVETPSGQRTVTLPAGQSSVDFAWDANTSGVSQIRVSSGRLHPASGLVLVPPPARFMATPAPQTLHIPPNIAEKKKSNAHKASDYDYKVMHEPLPNVIVGGASHGITAAGGGGTAGPAATGPGGGAETAGAADTGGAQSAAQASKIQLYVAPLPIYGDAVKHVWQAKVSIAAMAGQSLAPAASNVPVHIQANAGSLSDSDVVIHAGEFGNFDHPVLLTSNRSGTDTVRASSSLGTAEDVAVNYLQPAPQYLRLSVGTPVLSGSGSSTASVQACLLDESQGITSADRDITVNLSAPGQLAAQSVTIKQDSSCSSPITWTAEAGLGIIRAESAGLQPDQLQVKFPAFPWRYPMLAALGGLLGAFVIRAKRVLSAAWWSHTWSSLLLGAVLGVIFYLFARFNALVLPEGWVVKLQNVPVVSSIGAFLIGFVGGVLGRSFWLPKKDKAEGAAGGK